MGRVTRGKFHSTRRGKVFSRCAAVRKIIQLFGVVRLGIIITSVVQAHAEKIVLDGAREGQVFEGVGAVSAGGSSRLLIDYPEPQRSEILDFLFKPGFGASFQHLKVEIGGGINSTDGTEPTHMRDGSDLSCSRGYEWWLMEQARKRNPQIVLDCLAWGAPAWIGQGNYYSQDMADYIANFIAGARKEHNLEIQYTGVWNETPYDVEWIKLLRRTLDQRGFAQVKIVAADEMGSWSIGEKIAADPELAAAVNVIGSHYSSTVPAEVRSLGKPIWASESGAQSGEFWAAKQTAALLNRNYIEGAITKTEIWSLVSSCYEVLLLSDSGPMLAREPWSGHYEVLPALWSIAHTTQFAKPGWKYLDGNACGTLPLGGTFVSLKSTNNSDYSIIIETGDASAPQTLMFVLTNGLSTGPVHIWRTSSAGSFQPAGTIFVGGTQFSFEFKRNSIYTLSNAVLR